ncbi:MAG: ATP-dependent zinc protease [Succinivibrionaceae bacterium]
MKKIFLSLIVTSSITLLGCQNQVPSLSKNDLALLNEVKTEQNNTKLELSKLVNAIQESQNIQSSQLNQCLQQLNNHKSVLKELNNIQKLVQEKKSLYKMTEQPQGSVDMADNSLKTPDGKLILGSTEWIYVAEADVLFESRIDTGAAISSINAINIENFERDGKKWVKFDIPIKKDYNIKVEAPFVRSAVIKQASADGKKDERPVVKLTLKLGNFTKKAEFTLRDRNSMQYALLIGREFIKDIAVVDVSKDAVQPKHNSKNSISSLEYDQEKGIFILNSRTVKIDSSKNKKKKIVQAIPMTSEENKNSTKKSDE